jgi:hypothetical protein
VLWFAAPTLASAAGLPAPPLLLPFTASRLRAPLTALKILLEL